MQPDIPRYKHIQIRDDVIPNNQIIWYRKQTTGKQCGSCRVRFPNGPFGERTLQRKIPYPPRALLTVFSITQSDLSITLAIIHDITDLETHF